MRIKGNKISFWRYVSLLQPQGLGLHFGGSDFPVRFKFDPLRIPLGFQGRLFRASWAASSEYPDRVPSPFCSPAEKIGAGGKK